MAEDVERLVAEVEVKTTKALAAIKKWKVEVRKELRQLIREGIELALDADTEPAERKIRETTEKKRSTTVDVDADTSDAEREIDKTTKRRRSTTINVKGDKSGLDDALDGIDVPPPINIPVSVDPEPAATDLRELERQLKTLEKARRNIELDANPKRALANLGLLKGALADLQSKTISANIDTDDLEARTKLAALTAEAAKLDGKTVDMKVDLNGAATAIPTLAALGDQVDEVGDQAEQTERDVDSLNRSTRSLGVTFGVAAVAARAFRTGLGKITGVSAMTKAMKENRQEIQKNTVATEVLNKSMDRLSKQMVKTGIATYGLHKAFDGLVGSMLKLSLASTVVTGALGLVGVVLGAVGAQAVALVAVLTASLGAAVLGLGGMFLAAAGGAGVLMLAFKGLEDDASPAAESLKKLIEAFKGDFQQIGRTIRSVLVGPLVEAGGVIRNKFMPLLQGGLKLLAGAMGDVVKMLANGLTSPSVMKNLWTIFNGLVPVLKDIGRILVNLISGFSSLFAGAMPGIIAFSGYITELTARFTQWVSRIRSDGRLAEFLAVGIDGFKALWEGVVNWGSALMQILRLAAPLGLVLMRAFQDGGAAFAIWTKSAEGISKITYFFDAMAPVITALGGFISELGKELIGLITDIAPMVPPVIDALTSIIPALREGLAILIPVGLQIIKMIAPLVPLLLPIVEVIAQLAETFAIALEPVIREVLKALGDIAPIIGDMAVAFSYAGAIVGAFIEPIRVLVMTAGPMLVDLFNKVFPPIVEMTKALGPLISELGIALVGALIEVVGALVPLIPAFTDIALRLLPVFTDALVELTPFIGDMVTLLVDIAIPLANMVTGFAEWADSIGLLTPLLQGLLALMVVGQIAKFAGAFKLLGFAMGSLPFKVATSYLKGYLGTLAIGKLTRFTTAQNLMTDAITRSARASRTGAAVFAGSEAALARTGTAAATAAPKVGLFARAAAGIGSAMSTIGLAAPAASGGFGAVGGAAGFAVTPIGWVVIAIAAVIAAITALYFHWKPMRDFIDGLWQSMQRLWDQFLAGAEVIGGKLVTAFVTVLPYIEKVWDLFYSFYIEPVVVGFQALAALLTGDVAGAFDIVSEYTGKMLDTLGNLGGFLVGLGQTILSSIGDAALWLVRTGTDMMLGLLRGAVQGSMAVIQYLMNLPLEILGALPGAIDWLFDTGIDMLAGLVNGLYTGAVAVTRFFADLPGRILSFAGSALDWLVNTGIDMLAGLVNGLYAGAVALYGFFTSLPERIMSFAAGATDWMVDTGIDILAGLVNGIYAGASAVYSFFRGLPNRIRAFLFNARVWLVTTGADILNGLRQGIDTAVTNVTSFFDTLPLRLTIWAANARQWLVTTGWDILVGLRNGAVNALQSVLNFFTSLPERIRNFFRGAKDWLIQAGRDIISGLWEGIKSAANWFKEKFDRLIKALIPDQVEGIMGISSPSKVMAQYGVYTMQGLGEGISKGAPKVSGAVAVVLEDITSVTTGYSPPPIPMPELQTEQISSQFGLLQASLASSAQQTSAQLSSALTDSMQRASSVAAASARTSGFNVAEGLRQGVAEGSSAAGQQAFDLGALMPTNINLGAGVQSPSKLTQASGRNITIGLQNGMAEMSGEVFSTAWNIGNQATKEYDKGAGNASPSKLTEISGMNVSYGFAIGMAKGQPLVDGVANGIGQTAIVGVESTDPEGNGAFLGGLLSWGFLSGLDSATESILGWAGSIADGVLGALGGAWEAITGMFGSGPGGMITFNPGALNTGRTGGGGGSWSVPGDVPGGRGRGGIESFPIFGVRGAPQRSGGGRRIGPAERSRRMPDLLEQMPIFQNGTPFFQPSLPMGNLGALGSSPMPGFGAIDNGIYESLDKGEGNDFFAWLKWALDTRATIAMDWGEVNKLASGLVAKGGFKSTKLADYGIRLTAPDGRFFTLYGDPKSMLKDIDKDNTMRRPTMESSKVVSSVLGAGMGELGTTKAPMTSFSPNASFTGFTGSTPNYAGIKMPSITPPSFAGARVPTPSFNLSGATSVGGEAVASAVQQTGATQVSQLSKVISELQNLRNDVQSIEHAPLIGELVQNDVGERSAQNDLVAAALKASAMMGR